MSGNGGRFSPRRWVLRTGVAILVWVALLLCARWFGSRPATGLIALGVAAVSLTVWLYADVLDLAGEPPAGPPPVTEPVRPRGSDARLTVLTRVVAGHLDARRVVGDTLQRHLMSVVDQRLMARHGVSWRTDPERAAALLDPDLLALAQQTAPYPRMSVRQIDALLSRMEAL